MLCRCQYSFCISQTSCWLVVIAMLVDNETYDDTSQRGIVVHHRWEYGIELWKVGATEVEELPSKVFTSEQRSCWRQNILRLILRMYYSKLRKVREVP